jgi:PAS domain S-box-containing protein
MAKPSHPAPQTTKVKLCGLGHLVGLQAARADVNAPRPAARILDADLLQVRVEAPPGGDHRVTPRVAERGALAAAVADLGHRTRDGRDAHRQGVGGKCRNDQVPRTICRTKLSRERSRGRDRGLTGEMTSRHTTPFASRAHLVAESQAMQSSIADYIGDMVSAHAPDGTYRYVSAASKDLLGYEPHELVGTSAYDHFHPDDAPKVAVSIGAPSRGPRSRSPTGCGERTTSTSGSKRRPA